MMNLKLRKSIRSGVFKAAVLILTIVMLATSVPTTIALDALQESGTLIDQTFTLRPEKGVTLTLKGLMPKGGHAEADVSIADNAFNGCDDLKIYCSFGSYAHQYAMANNIDYVFTDSSYILGDSDNSGDVNVIDATLIQKLLIGKKSDPYGLITIRGDVNGDKKISIRDATLIQMHISGVSVPYDIAAKKEFDPAA